MTRTYVQTQLLCGRAAERVVYVSAFRFSMTFEVCVDKTNAERCLKELEDVATDERESKKRVEKATRTRDFLKQFIAYSQKYATLKSDEGGMQVWCLERTTYSLRNAAGRWYANASLANQSENAKDRDKIRSLSVQCCPKIVRSILFGYRDHDVDISNAHPTIMQGLAAQLKRPTPMLDDYVKNRSRPGGVYCKEGWILDVAQFHGIAETYPGRQKECAKELFLRLMYGGKYESWCNDHLDAKSNSNFHPQVQLLAKEIADIHDMVLRCDEWAEFCSFHRQRIKSEDAQADVKVDSYDLEGFSRRERPIVPRIVALVLQTIEADMLQVVMKVFVERGHSISAIIHDGFHVNGKRLDDESYMRGLLDEAERRVKAIMNYDIVVEEKPFYGLHTRPVKLDV